MDDGLALTLAPGAILVPVYDKTLLCSRCRQYSYIVYRNKKGALVCHRCRRAKAVHKSDMADPEEQLLRGQSPKWEEE